MEYTELSQNGDFAANKTKIKHGFVGDRLGEFFKALSKVQGELKPVKKDSINKFNGSTYASLEAYLKACLPLLSKNEIAVIQPPYIIDKKTVLRTYLMHSSGSGMWGELELNPMYQKKGAGWVDSKDPQTQGADVTYKRRYLLTALVGMAQEDTDLQEIMNMKEPAKPRSRGKGKELLGNKKANGAEPPEKEEDSYHNQENYANEEDWQKIDTLISVKKWESADIIKIMENDFSVSRFTELTKENYELFYDIVLEGPEKWKSLQSEKTE